MTNDFYATVLILASALLHATSSSVFRVDGDRLVRMAAGSLISLPVMGSVLFFVPFPPPEVWPILLSSLGVLIVFQFSAIKALEFGALSYVYPVSRGLGPVFVVLISYLYLKGQVDWAAIAGVSFVALGVMELATRGFRDAIKKHHMALATGLAVVNGACIGIYTLLDSRGVRMVENPFSYIAWLMVLFGVTFLILPILMRGKAVVASLAVEWRRGIFGAVIGMASYITALLALRLGSAVEIAALRETSIMFAVLIGYFFLGEGIGIRRLIAVALIAAGAIIIKSF